MCIWRPAHVHMAILSLVTCRGLRTCACVYGYVHTRMHALAIPCTCACICRSVANTSERARAHRVSVARPEVDEALGRVERPLACVRARAPDAQRVCTLLRAFSPYCAQLAT